MDGGNFPLGLSRDAWKAICLRLSHKEWMALTSVSKTFLRAMDELLNEILPLGSIYLCKLRVKGRIPHKKMSSWKSFGRDVFYEGKVRLRICAHYLYHRRLTSTEIELFTREGYFSAIARDKKIRQADSERTLRAKNKSLEATKLEVKNNRNLSYRF